MVENTIFNYFSSTFSKYLSRNSIIKDYRYLDENFVPSDIKHRDRQKEIALSSIGDFISNNKVTNLFLYGSTGTGKTLLARFVSFGVKGYALKNKLKIKVSYINCRTILSNESEYYILKKIYEDLTNINIKTGISKVDILDNIKKFLKENQYKLILILDEVDFLFSKKNIDMLLYILLRNYDLDIYDKVLLMFISNNITFIDDLDSRVKSSLSSVYKLLFPPYNYPELKDILLERAKLALKENSYNEEIINYIAARVTKSSGDARVAINVLKLAASIASSKNRSYISLEDVEEAFNNLEMDILDSIIYSLNKTQKLIVLSIISEQLKAQDYVSFSEIYEKYVKIADSLGYKPLDKNTIYKNLRVIELIFGNLMDFKTVSLGKGGYKMLVKILVEDEKLIKMSETIRNSI